MPDIVIIERKGEKRPLFGSATASSGTLTVSGTPTYAVYDSTGTAVSGQSGNVTGFDNTALATVRAWVNLDTSAAALVAGNYNVVITILAASSVDSMTRTYETEVGLVISGL